MEILNDVLNLLCGVQADYASSLLAAEVKVAREPMPEAMETGIRIDNIRRRMNEINLMFERVQREIRAETKECRMCVIARATSGNSNCIKHA